MRLFHALLIPALTATVTVCLLGDTSTPIRATRPIGQVSTVTDLDIEAELHTGCTQLIDLALTDSPDAAWAIAELERASVAPWASDALRTQAREGLARCAARVPVIASR